MMKMLVKDSQRTSGCAAWLRPLIVLLAAIPVIKSAVLRCDSHNRDPCTKFPSLCTEGGGLCVITAPCEYECVCPPDGRRGRDCSSNRPAPRPPVDLDPSTSNGGSLVESLLVFPKDLFLDMNHVEKRLEMVRITSPRPAAVDGGGSQMTTTMTTGVEVENNGRTLTDVRGKTQTEYSSSTQTSMPMTTTTTTIIPTHSSKVEPNPSNVVTTSQSPFDVPSSTSRLTTSHYPNSHTTNTPVQSTLIVENKSNELILQGDLHTTPRSDKVSLSTPESNLNLAVDVNTTGNDTINNSMRQEISTNNTASILSNTNTTNHTSSIPGTNNFESDPTQSKSVQIQTTGTSDIQSFTSSQLSLPRKTATQSENIDPKISENQDVFAQTGPAHELFPTFFSGGVESATPGSNQRPNAALTRVVQRVFHPQEGFPFFKRHH